MRLTSDRAKQAILHPEQHVREAAIYFPANIYVYQHQEVLPAPAWLHVLRLPLQGVFLLWAYWHTRPSIGVEKRDAT